MCRAYGKRCGRTVVRAHRIKIDAIALRAHLDRIHGDYAVMHESEKIVKYFRRIE